MNFCYDATENSTNSSQMKIKMLFWYAGSSLETKSRAVIFRLITN
jgi:hypothetical protein